MFESRGTSQCCEVEVRSEFASRWLKVATVLFQAKLLSLSARCKHVTYSRKPSKNAVKS
jgi:hypothetical protein